MSNQLKHQTYDHQPIDSDNLNLNFPFLGVKPSDHSQLKYIIRSCAICCRKPPNTECVNVRNNPLLDVQYKTKVCTHSNSIQFNTHTSLHSLPYENGLLQPANSY